MTQGPSALLEPKEPGASGTAGVAGNLTANERI